MPRDDITQVDEALAGRVASMSGGSQRWLKTALQSVLANDEMMGEQAELEFEPREVPEVPTVQQEVEREAEPEPERRPPDLEDALLGRVDLSERLEDFPELAEELEGLSDIIDLLREAGEKRRRRGEDILRREILGEEPDEGEDTDDETLSY